jgi:integrase
MVEVKHSLFPRSAADGRKRWILSVSIDGAKDWKQVSAPKEIQAKRMAEAWASGQLATIRETGELPGGSAVRTGITVAVLVEKAMKLRREQAAGRDVIVRQGTLITLESRARTLIAYWGEKRVDAVGVPEARALVRQMKADHAPNTVRAHATFAKQTFDIGKAEGWIKVENPFRNVLVAQLIPKARTVAKKPLAMSLEMADALVNGEPVPAFRRARYVVMIGGGLSDAEICGLRVGDVVFKGTREVPVPHLRVLRQLQVKGKAYGEPKTENRDRFVPMSPLLEDGLRWWLEEGWEMHAAIGRKPKASDPLFPKAGTASVMRVQRGPEDLRKDLRALGMPDKVPGKDGETLHNLTVHAGRRTFATLLEEVGVVDADSGAVMGHTGSTVTAANYIARHMVRLHGEVQRHPLRFSYVQSTVRTVNPRAQGEGPKVAKTQAESDESARTACGSS